MPAGSAARVLRDVRAEARGPRSRSKESHPPPHEVEEVDASELFGTLQDSITNARTFLQSEESKAGQTDGLGLISDVQGLAAVDFLEHLARSTAAETASHSITLASTTRGAQGLLATSESKHLEAVSLLRAQLRELQNALSRSQRAHAESEQAFEALKGENAVLRERVEDGQKKHRESQQTILRLRQTAIGASSPPPKVAKVARERELTLAWERQSVAPREGARRDRRPLSAPGRPRDAEARQMVVEEDGSFEAGPALEGPLEDAPGTYRDVMRLRKLLLQAQRHSRMNANNAAYWKTQHDEQKQLSETLSSRIKDLERDGERAVDVLEADLNAQLHVLKRDRDSWKERAEGAEARLLGSRVPSTSAAPADKDTPSRAEVEAERAEKARLREQLSLAQDALVVARETEVELRRAHAQDVVKIYEQVRQELSAPTASESTERVREQSVGAELVASSHHAKELAAQVERLNRLWRDAELRYRQERRRAELAEAELDHTRSSLGHDFESLRESVHGMKYGHQEAVDSLVKQASDTEVARAQAATLAQELQGRLAEAKRRTACARIAAASERIDLRARHGAFTRWASAVKCQQAVEGVRAEIEREAKQQCLKEIDSKQRLYTEAWLESMGSVQQLFDEERARVRAEAVAAALEHALLLVRRDMRAAVEHVVAEHTSLFGETKSTAEGVAPARELDKALVPWEVDLGAIARSSSLIHLLDLSLVPKATKKEDRELPDVEPFSVQGVLQRQLEEILQIAHDRANEQVEAAVSKAQADAERQLLESQEASEKTKEQACEELRAQALEREAKACSEAFERGSKEAAERLEEQLRTKEQQWNSAFESEVEKRVETVRAALEEEHEAMRAKELQAMEDVVSEAEGKWKEAQTERSAMQDRAESMKQALAEALDRHVKQLEEQQGRFDEEMTSIVQQIERLAKEKEQQRQDLLREKEEALAKLLDEHKEAVERAVKEEQSKGDAAVEAAIQREREALTEEIQAIKQVQKTSMEEYQERISLEMTGRIQVLQDQLAEALVELANVRREHPEGTRAAEPAAAEEDAGSPVSAAAGPEMISVGIQAEPEGASIRQADETATLLSSQRAEITAMFQARLERAAESRRELIQQMQQEARVALEHKVAEERKRAADDKEAAIKRVYEQAEKIVHGLEKKLESAIRARNVAEDMVDKFSVHQEELEQAVEKNRFKAELFHKTSMILRLRLAVAATTYTGMYASNIAVVKRTLGQRVVLLERRYEQDVSLLKRRADTAILRAHSAERSLLEIAKILGLELLSRAMKPGTIAQGGSLLSLIDGAGTVRLAHETQEELARTNDQINEHKAEIASLRERLRGKVQQRAEILGGARVYDAEINMIGKQIGHSNAMLNERDTSRMHRMHGKLEGLAAAAERIAPEIDRIDARLADLKDTRRALKLRARELENRFLSQVVKQHLQARASLLKAGLTASSLLPAQIARTPSPEPLELHILMPRTVLDIQDFEFDLGRRDYLRGHAIEMARRERARRELEERRKSAFAGVVEDTPPDDDDEEDGLFEMDDVCPSLRVLPLQLYSDEHASSTLATDLQVREALCDPVYNLVVGEGYVESCWDGTVSEEAAVKVPTAAPADDDDMGDDTASILAKLKPMDDSMSDILS
jgi:hypothetical protein